MITSFEVGSIFKIVDHSSPTLRNVFRAVTQLDKMIEQARQHLDSLAGTKLIGVATEIKAITAETAGLGKALGTASRGMGRLTKASGALGSATSAIAGVTSATQLLAAEWSTVAAQATAAIGAMRAAGRLRLPPPGGLPSLPGVPGGGGGGGGRRHGLHLGRVGASIPMPVGHVHASVPSSGSGVAAGAGLFGIYELGKYGMEPQHQEAALRLLGIPDATIASMSDEARQIAINVPGSGYAHNLQTMGELYSIVGAEGAMALAPKLAEIDRVQAMVGGKGKDQGSAYVLTRATELMGKLTNPVTHQVDMKLFSDVIDNMSRMSIATHGKVTPEEWLNYAKQAGPAAGNLNLEGLYTTAAIIQAMGGNRAGTAAAAIQRQFAGGVMTASKANELAAIGILKPEDYEVGRGGHVLVKNDAAKSFVDKLQHDPLDAVVKDLIPALESHGYTTNEQITKELYRILGTAPEQREIYEIIRGREQIRQERERAMGAQAPGTAIATLNQSDPTAVMSAFTTAFKDLLGALGGPLIQTAIPGIKELTTVLNELSALAARHKSETGVITSGLAGAATGAAVGFGVGWLGGPFGAAGGAAVGGALGTAYGFMAQPPEPHKTAYERRQERLRRQGLLTDESTGSAWNIFPPPTKVEVSPANVSINLDGKKVGEATMTFVARQSRDPAQGAPSFDPTRGTTSFDFSLVN